MDRCLVTGGTGFVGSHIVRLLSERNHDVSVLLRESSKTDLIREVPFKGVIGDITDIATLEKAMTDEIDTVFHNAAIMAEWGSKKRFFPVNVDGTRNVIEAMRKKDIQNLIYTSSTGVYGFPNKQTPITEADSWDPMNSYQKSKATAEELIKNCKNEYGLKVAMVRAPVVFGQGDMFTGPQFIEFLKDGKMVIFGGGNNTQTFVHAEDFARLLVLAGEEINKINGHAFNVGSFTCQFRELVEAIAEELDVSKNFMNIPYTPALLMGKMTAGLYRAFNRKKAPLITPFVVKMFGTEYIIDYSKAKRELGYEPKWNLQTTVQDIVQWGGFVKPR